MMRLFVGLAALVVLGGGAARGTGVVQAEVVGWRSLQGPEGGSVLAVAVDPADPRIVYAGTDEFNGVFKSTDGGASWRTARKGLEVPIVIDALAVDPSHPQTVFAGTGQGTGVFKSTDGGASWRQDNGVPNRFPSDAFVNALALDPRNGSVVYAGTSDGLLKTTNAGRTWTVANKDLWADVLAIDPKDSSTIYAGTIGDGLFKSTDAGRTWKAQNTGLPSTDGRTGVWSLAVDPENTQTVYAAANGGLYRSQNGGNAWVQLRNTNLSDPIAVVAVDSLNPQTVYAATRLGVARSDDGGRS
jgi:photosystem II stability/assembly factor-like uncharacterized protein